MTYKEKLQDPRWQRKRLEIFQRDDFKCTICDSEKDTLQVHHYKYNGNPWEANNEDLYTLCKHCHEVVEVCKGSELIYHNINRIDRPHKILYLLNCWYDGDMNTVIVLDNSSGRFEFTTQMMSKEFVETLLKTF